MNFYTPNLPSLVLIFSSLLITSNSLYAWANRHSTGFDHVLILAGNALWLFALGKYSESREMGNMMDWSWTPS